MNLINNALSQGFTAANVIQYLSRHFPHARKKIEKAVAEGFSESEIIKYLGGGRKAVNAPVTEHEKTRQSDRDKQSNLERNAVKGGLALGATALGGYALSRALPRAGQALTGQLLPALPQGPLKVGGQARGQLPAPGQAAIQPPPPKPPQGPLPYTNPSAQNRPLRPTPTQPTPQPSPSIQAPAQLPQALSPIQNEPPKTAPLPPALQKQVASMLQAGNDIETIAGALQATQPKVVKEYEKAANASIQTALEEFANQANLPMQQPVSTSAVVKQEEKIPSQSQSTINEPIKKTITPKTEGGIPSLIEQGRRKYEENMGKGSTVALPSGEIGEISDIRQGIATVNANGKEFRRKMEELIESPLPQKELHEIHDDLIRAIEKETGEQVSRAINYVGFNPEEKSLVVHYSGSGKDSYVFEDLSEQRINQLLELEQLRRTSGNNLVGGWKEGTKSILGGKMHDLVKELEAERGGKGTAHAFKYRTLYDAIEPAKKSKEEHMKKIAAEKKESKAKEKENPEQKHSLDAYKEKVKKEQKKELDKEYKKALNAHVEKLISDMKIDIKEREKKIKEDSNPQTKSLRESTLKSKKEKLSFYEEYYPKHGYKGVLTPNEYNEIKRKVKFLYG